MKKERAERFIETEIIFHGKSKEKSAEKEKKENNLDKEKEKEQNSKKAENKNFQEAEMTEEEIRKMIVDSLQEHIPPLVDEKLKNFQDEQQKKVDDAKKVVDDDEKQYAQFCANQKRFQTELEEEAAKQKKDNQEDDKKDDDTKDNQDDEEDEKDKDDDTETKDNQDDKEPEKKEDAKLPIKSFHEFDTINFSDNKTTFEGTKKGKKYAGSVDGEGNIANLACISHKIGNSFEKRDIEEEKNPENMGVKFNEVAAGLTLEDQDKAFKNFSEYDVETEAAFNDPKVEKMTKKIGNAEIPLTQHEKRVIYMQRYFKV